MQGRHVGLLGLAPLGNTLPRTPMVTAVNRTYRQRVEENGDWLPAPDAFLIRRNRLGPGACTLSPGGLRV